MASQKNGTPAEGAEQDAPVSEEKPARKTISLPIMEKDLKPPPPPPGLRKIKKTAALSGKGPPPPGPPPPPPQLAPPPPVQPSALSSETTANKSKASSNEDAASDNEQKGIHMRNISAQDLLHGKRKLRKSMQGLNPKRVQRSDVFSDKKIPLDHFPINDDFERLFAGHKEVVTNLNFSGIDQITDYVCHAFGQRDSLQTIRLTACDHLTDQGVIWLAKNFSNLCDVSFEGCRQITERSVNALFTCCPKLLYVNLTATNVGNLYLPEHLSEQRVSLQLYGCPLLTPTQKDVDHNATEVMSRGDYFAHLRKTEPFNVYKAVVITDEQLVETNFIEMLSGQSSSHTPYVHIRNGQKHPKSGMVYNITQCSQDFADPFLTQRTVYILPYLSKDGGSAVHSVVKRILHIVSQVPTAVFGVVAVMDSNDSHLNADVDEKRIKTIIRDAMKSEVDNIVKLTLRQAEQGEVLNFPRQQRLGKLEKLRDLTEELRKTKDASGIVFCQTPIFIADADKKKENGDVLNDLLEKCKGVVDEKHSWFGRFSESLVKVFRGHKGKPGIFTDTDFVQSLMDDHISTFGDSAKYYWKCLEYLHMLGLVVHIPVKSTHNLPSDQGLVLSDPDWFSDRLNTFLNECTGMPLQSEKESYISACIRSLSENQTQKESEWRALLQTTGVMRGGKSSQITPFLLPKPPQNPYFQRYLTTDETEYLKHFNACVIRYRLPTSLPPTVLTQLAASPVINWKLAWQEGLVIQNPIVETMIGLVEHGMGAPPVLEVVCQMLSATLTLRMKSMLRNEARKYALVLDSILHAHGIGFHAKEIFNGVTQSDNDYEYLITLCTGDQEDAGTDADIEIAFVQGADNNPKHVPDKAMISTAKFRPIRKSNREVKFQRNQMDTFVLTLSTPNIKDWPMIRVLPKENSSKPYKWYLKFLQIEDPRQKKFTRYGFERVMKANIPDLGQVLPIPAGLKHTASDGSILMGTPSGCSFEHYGLAAPCQNCGTMCSDALMLWEMKSIMQPTFAGQYRIQERKGDASNQANLHDAGQIVTGNVVATNIDDIVLQVEQNMHPVFFNSFHMVMVSKKTAMAGVLYDKDGSKLVVDDRKRGDDILIRCQATQDSTKVEIQIYVNKMMVKTLEVSQDTPIYPIIESQKTMTRTLVSGNKLPLMSSPTTLQVGMRLEALDRLTPNLVCTATIAEIYKGSDPAKQSQVLIHFDGWTSKYDYWTDFSTPDLHPVGWCRENLHKFRKYNPNLQPPKNRSPPHNWNAYLAEVKQWPVPYHLFNQDQTSGCTPWLVPAELQRQLSSSVSNHCIFIKERVGVWEKELEKVKKGVVEGLNTNAQTGSDLRASEPYAPVVLALQDSLSAEQLRKPYLDMFSAAADRRTTLHKLCPYQRFPHFTESRLALDTEEKQLRSQELFADSYLVTLCHLLKTKNFMPDAVSTIFPNLKDSNMTYLEIQECLIRIFDMILGNYLLNGHDLKNGVKGRVPSKEANAFLNIEENAKITDCLCEAHTLSLDFSKKGVNQLDLSIFDGYGHLIDHLVLGEEDKKTEQPSDSGDLNREETKLTTIPAETFQKFPNLTCLNVAKQRIQELPGLESCKKLQMLNLCENPISLFPVNFENCVDLVEVNIGKTKLSTIPEGIFKAANLEILIADTIPISTLSKNIGDLKKLRILDVSSTSLSELPEELALCQELTVLKVSGIPWTTKTIMSLANMNELYDAHPIMAKVPVKERTELFRSLDEADKGYLNTDEIAKFNFHIFENFPRFRGTDDEEMGGFPKAVLQLRKLTCLHMEYQGLTRVPVGMAQLTALEELSVAHNPLLQSVSSDLCSVTPFAHFNLNGCPSLKTPPKEIVTKGFRSVMGYLRRLHMGSVSCKRTKLMMVGLGGAGKTSLVEKLVSGGRSYINQNDAYYDDDSDDFDEMGQEITDGIDIVKWAVQYGEDTVTYSVWDFAGQSVYYNTHQFFLSNRAVYLLLWNIRLGYEHAGLDFWLSSIACHAPKAPILVVGTHVDQVQKYWLPQEEFQRQYPQIRGFHAISCYKNTGLKELQKNLLEVTLKEKYMGEKIPEAWLNFETKMTGLQDDKKKGKDNKAVKKDIAQWKEVEELASLCGINDRSEVFQAVGFLHDLGAVQHFQNEFLRNLVVINPQWIVDAMACVVNVRDTPIKDGRLAYPDLGAIWGLAQYPKDMLSWLLRLTEEFDLTFPIPDEKCNIVPCLLPAEPPEYQWLDVQTVPGFKETKMVYQFKYLPAGLFNRVQVRLYQYSDSSVIWKKGSKLVKNGHHALITIQGEKEVLVKVQGYRPENILFLVHEVFEGLIAMSFHGVTYDYSIPCTDCLKTGSHEPCLFSASKIRRATELKAPFLQCDKYFHTVTLTELHASMPPDQNSEFDLHLERSLHELSDLHDDLTYDVFMVYAKANIPGFNEDGKRVAPRRIYEDLNLNDFKVWFPSDPTTIDLQAHAVTMRSAKVAVICISNEFVADEDLCNVFHFLKTNLQKTIQLVVLGDNMEWKKTSLGLLLSDDVFVNMIEPKKYQIKFKELMDLLRTKTSVYKELAGPAPAKCFISYCWSNSQDAVSKGTRPVKGAVGWGDPRSFKTELEQRGISCWLDVERVGQGGLFEDIADGLRKAKVIVACVSDEYARSKNCQMEFRFASTTLNVPIIIAVVGTGYTWENTEVGMLSIGNPKINFQHESKNAIERLVAEVQKNIPEDDKNETEASRTPSASDNSQIAFQELLELAQRKFQRQVATISDKMETQIHYPRLFVLDFLSEEEKGEINLTTARKLLKSQEKGKEEDECGERDQCTDQSTERSDQRDDGSNQSAQITPRPSSSKPSMRPKSGLRKRPSALTSVQAAMALTSMLEHKTYDEVSTGSDYCIRFLCEHEGDWHCHGKCLPLPAMTSRELDVFVAGAAPYMARLLGILKHSAAQIQLMTSERGTALRQLLEDKCGFDSNFDKEYEDMRTSVMDLDKDLTRGMLKRCYLPSGKILWLCPKHQQADDRITVFSNDEDDGFYDDNYVKDNIFINATASETHTSKTVKDTPKEPPKKVTQEAADTSRSVQEPAKSASSSTGKEKSPLKRKQTRDVAAEKLKSQVSNVGVSAAASAASGQTNPNKSKACSVM